MSDIYSLFEHAFEIETAGFRISFLIALSVTVVGFIAVMRAFAKGPGWQKISNGEKMVNTAISATVTAGFGLFIFMILFSIMNFVLDESYRSWEVLKSELVNGGLVLKLSSILIAYHGVIGTLQMGKGLGPKWDGEWNDEEVKSYFFTIQFLQVLVYACSLVLLTIYKISGISTFLTAVLSWMIFLVLDDWVIVKYYATRMEGHVPKTTGLMLFSANIGIVVISSVILYQSFVLLAVLPFVLITICLSWMFFFVARGEQTFA